MSWIENIKQDMVIKTGDGKEYRPMWFNATYLVVYNIAEFDFRRVKGTLVLRGTPRGRVFDVDLRFQGDDCLTIGDAFKQSAEHPAPWSFYHPMYGTMNVQPAELRFDNNVLNVTRITGIVIETQAKAPITVVVDPIAKVDADAPVVVDNAATTFVEDAPTISPSTLTRISAAIDATYEAALAKMSNVQANVDQYTAAYDAANSVLNTAIYDTTDIIERAGYLLSLPYAFENAVQQRMDMFKVQFGIIYNDITAALALGIGDTRQMKMLYEHNGTVTVASMCRATVTKVGTDYAYRPDILRVVADIITTYNAYLTGLCEMLTENNAELTSYAPNADNIIKLANLVYYTTTYLYGLASSALQQRVYTVPVDTTIINITDEIYGLKSDDSTLQRMIDANRLTLDEYLLVKQGRELVYYV